MTDGGALWPERPKLPDGPAPGFAYARLLSRSAATLIDYLVCIAVAGIPITLLGAGERTAGPFLASVANVIGIVAFFGVFGVTAAIWNGQTIGGRVLGIRIVKRNDGSAIGWDRALLRPIGHPALDDVDLRSGQPAIAEKLEVAAISLPRRHESRVRRFGNGLRISPGVVVRQK